jgi:TetR/AcrR family transcriptional repressor of nem operon
MPWEKAFDVDDVLNKAMEAFWAGGYEATSMQDLVKSTGVNRASLYATYGDKHSLFLKSLRMYDERQRHALLSRLEAGPSPKAAIKQLFEAFAGSAVEDGANKGCFMTNTALELAARDREARQVVATAQEQLEAFFARMVKAGQARGEIRRTLSPGTTASGLLATLLGLLVLVRSRPHRKVLDAVVTDAMQRLG